MGYWFVKRQGKVIPGMMYNATTKIGSLLAVFIVLFLGAFAAASVFPDSIREV